MSAAIATPTTNASTEPRRDRRGELRQATTAPYTDLMLQRSRGVIAAERWFGSALQRCAAPASTEPRRDRRGEAGGPTAGTNQTITLQRSRGVIAAERGIARMGQLGGILASTEPRRDRRGEGQEIGMGFGVGRASTEPRRDRRGELETKAKAMNIVALQRSRGVIAAERRPSPPIFSSTSGFNGAAA